MPSKLLEHVRGGVGDTLERAMEYVRREIDQLRDQLNRQPITAPDSRLYAPGTPLVNGSNVIAHKLGRVPKGYVVTRAQGTAPVLYETARDDRFVTLSSTGTPTVEILFF